jgi:hypothetical protein
MTQRAWWRMEQQVGVGRRTLGQEVPAVLGEEDLESDREREKEGRARERERESEKEGRGVQEEAEWGR